MNDLHEVPKNTTLSTYADDTQIFYAGNNKVELEQAISTELLNGLIRTKCKEFPANTQLHKYTAIVFELVHQDLYAKIQSSP